jgi:hypothetical protein
MWPSGALLEMTEPAPIADRLGKFIRLLSSDKDGEVVAAARAIVRTLQAEKLDIHVLADMIKKPNGALSETDAKRIYDAGFNDGFRKAENAQHGPGNFRNVDGAPCWNEIALWCQRRGERLKENERQFIDDVASRTVWREPTEKQGMWLMSIFYRLGGPR